MGQFLLVVYTFEMNNELLVYMYVCVFLTILIGEQLLNDVVLVSAVQHEPSISIPISIAPIPPSVYILSWSL